MKISLPSDNNIKKLSVINGLKFSSREIEIIAFLIAGRSTKKIAQFFSLSPRTVENYIYNMMGKLGVNSRQGIIDFIEKSDKFSLIKAHHEKLVIHDSFIKSLNNLSKLLPEKKYTCALIYWPHQPYSQPLTSFISEAFQYMSIEISNEPQESDLALSQLLNEPQKDTYKIYILPSFNPVLSLEKAPPRFKSYNNLILLLEKEAGDNFSEIKDVIFIDVAKQKNAYYAFFEILKQIFPQLDFENVVSGFDEKFKGDRATIPLSEQDHLNDTHKQNFEKKSWLYINDIYKKWVYALTLLFLIPTSIGISIFFIDKNHNDILDHSHYKLVRKDDNGTLTIRNDLAIPVEAAFLNRPDLLSQLNKKFNEKEGIQTVAIIGIGGSGKTTLARQYVR